MKKQNYTFGDNEEASVRLRRLAELYEQETREFLQSSSARKPRLAVDLGCAQAHRGNRSKALSLLRQSVDHGLPPFMAIGMVKDPDLKSLQGDPRFDVLIAHAKERAAATQTSK